jgi:hypothetical protein
MENSSTPAQTTDASSNTNSVPSPTANPVSNTTSPSAPTTPATPIAVQSVTTAPAKVDPPAVATETSGAKDASVVSQPIVPTPIAAAAPETTKQPKGKTKGKVYNAAIVLTELYSQLEMIEQLGARAPSTRTSVLNGILKARDGLIQMQDLLKED